MYRTVTCGKALVWSQTLGREGGREGESTHYADI